MCGLYVNNFLCKWALIVSFNLKVVRAVGGKIPVLIDGGVRRGTDIFKALALGAQAVMIGRPVLYGLAAKGENGVRRVIEMLKDELEPTMALSGCLTVKDITRSHERSRQPEQQLHIMAMSCSSTCTVEEVASSCNAVFKRRDVIALLVQRAERNGFKAIILTVDAPRMIVPQLKNFEGLYNLDKGSRLEAIATGMLDASLSWKVVRAVGGKNHVLFDGGVRRGTDISKVGRPVIYGLAAKGEYGVRRVIEMLKDELELTIALSGCPTVNDIIKSLVRTELDGLNCWL
ncbi:hypothetical protein TEA_029728 [Camellia sinensis var. sinensis]|uniref:FMN hydroxy acid dehydrogenase domain-containing protein n=1 Tax=Camellia sinensis var. sinensis TaxID=542762 RepID=A0A4S4EAA6_CAMSN|nr:hypothetical protein TEA_029728 [Camellia sinensis var. sinensis]